MSIASEFKEFIMRGKKKKTLSTSQSVWLSVQHSAASSNHWLTM